MQNVKPDGENGGQDMGPVSERPQLRILDDQRIQSCPERRVCYPRKIQPGQGDSRNQENQTHRKKRVTDPDGATIGPIVSVFYMQTPEHDKRQNQQETENQMSQKHVLVKIILVSDSFFEPFQKS